MRERERGGGGGMSNDGLTPLTKPMIHFSNFLVNAFHQLSHERDEVYNA